MDAIEDEFDDFLNECFCKSPKEKQNEFVTHQIDSAAEDCAERALNDSDSDIKEEEGDKDAEDEKKSECEHEEPKNKRKKSSKSKAGLKTKTDLKDGGESMKETKLSEYEHQKQRNIEENKTRLASIKDGEFQAAMGDLTKGGKKKNKKGDKSKPNQEQRRTGTAADPKWVFPFIFAQLYSDVIHLPELTPPRENQFVRYVTDVSTSNVHLSDLTIQDKRSCDGEETMSHAAEIPDDKAGADKGGNNEAEADTQAGTKDKKTAGSDAGESSATNFAGLTEASSHTATDSDVIMNDGVAERAHGGAKKDSPSGDTSSASFPSLVGSSPPSPAQDASVNVSAALASADASFVHASTAIASGDASSGIASPALGSPVASSLKALPPQALRATSTPLLLPCHDSVPAYLTQAILTHLRTVSSNATWQALVNGFLQFERASPPSGVSFHSTSIYLPYPLTRFH